MANARGSTPVNSFVGVVENLCINSWAILGTFLSIFHSFIVISRQYVLIVVVIAAGDVSLGSAHRLLGTHSRHKAVCDVSTALWRHMVRCERDFEKDADSNLIDEQRDKFHLNWVISIRQELVNSYEHNWWTFLQIVVWNKNLEMCCNSRENRVHISTSVASSIYY